MNAADKYGWLNKYCMLTQTLLMNNFWVVYMCVLCVIFSTSQSRWRTCQMISSVVSLMTTYWQRDILCWTWSWTHPILPSRLSTVTLWVETRHLRVPLCPSKWTRKQVRPHTLMTCWLHPMFYFVLCLELVGYSVLTSLHYTSEIDNDRIGEDYKLPTVCLPLSFMPFDTYH